jgi:hypothetical protein
MRDTPRFVDAYNAFVDRSLHNVLYCHTWWLDAVAPGRYELLTIESDNTIRAAWPVVWAEDSRQRRIVTPLLTQNLGILIAPLEGKYAERLSQEHQFIEKLIDLLPPGTHVDQRFHERFTNWLPFSWRGFKQTTRYSYFIDDLSNLDSIWSEMRNTMRTEVRKAQKHGVHVRETDDVEFLYAIAKRSYERQGRRIPYSIDLVRRIDEACRAHAGRRILVAEGADGRAHAAHYMVYDEDRAILVITGADPELRGSSAGPLLNWELIQFASTVSKRFDFAGSMKQPIEANFRSFGARQVQYFHIWGERRRERYSSIRARAGYWLRRMARVIDPQGD